MLITIPFGLYLLQNYKIKNFQIDYWFPPKDKTINNYEIIRCNYSLIEPKIAFVSDQVLLGEYPEIAIYFSEMKNTIYGKVNENYLGATTVTNTTFDELVAMVKEDCSQFQEDYNNPDSNGIDWGYREADPPEPPKTEEELEYETEQNYFDQIKSIKYIFNETFTDFQQEKFIEMFGDIRSMTNDEIFNLKKTIDEGGGLEVLFKEYLFDEEGNLIFRNEAGEPDIATRAY